MLKKRKKYLRLIALLDVIGTVFYYSLTTVEREKKGLGETAEKQLCSVQIPSEHVKIWFLFSQHVWIFIFMIDF